MDTCTKTPVPARAGPDDEMPDMQENIPMHPDDFNALLAWITAKRLGEKTPEISAAEKYRHLLITG